MASIGDRGVRGLRNLIRSAVVVDRPLSFVVRDLAARGLKPMGVLSLEGRYKVRDSTVEVALRHGMRDTSTFREIFVDELYAPPSALRLLREAEIKNIVDLGGNIGLFAAWVAAHYPHAHLAAFEPDPENANRYSNTLSMLNRSDWSLHEAFASSTDGWVTFRTGEETTGSRINDGDGQGVRVKSVDVFPELLEADLIKMDIEGGEWDLLLDPRMSRLKAAQIVLEYHASGAPGKDAREAVNSLLDRLGYRIHELFYSADEGVGMLWAYR